jgi:hypothetical protein
MRITLAILLFFGSVFFAKAFAQKADSLEIVLFKTKADSSKSILLSLLSDELTQILQKQWKALERD